MIFSCPYCAAKNRVPAGRLAEHPRCGKCHQSLTPSAPIAIGSAAEFDELVAGSPLPVVVDFWAAWCGPCRMVAPEVDRLAKTRAGKIVVAKIDTEALPELAGRYGIQSIPTFVAFSGGREAARAMGAMSADQLARHLGL